MQQQENKKIEELRIHLRANPNSILFARLADLLLENGKTEQAMEVCEEGLKNHPYYVTGHFVMGKCYFKKEMYDQAQKEFKRVLFFDPKYIAAHELYAEIVKDIGWENAVENSYKKILEIDPLNIRIQARLDELLAKKEPEFPPQIDDKIPLDITDEESDILAENTTPLEENLMHEKKPFDTIDEGESRADESAFAEGDEEKFSTIIDEIFDDDIDTEQRDITRESTEPDAIQSETSPPSEEDELSPFEDFLDDTEFDEFEKREIDSISSLSEDLEAPIEMNPRDDQQESSGHPPESHRFNESERTPADSPAPDFLEAEDESLHPEEDDASLKLSSSRKREKIVTPTLGEIYAAQGQYAKAIGVFEILKKKEPNNQAYIDKISYLKRKLEESRF
ncbi:tetratricopeptide repeat protein [candidate division KSB1 bacterium]|nr:tetratricopeptide repeat protein [candidate division KSB1 bacterium]